MTTQAQPDWNAEMQRQIKATESAQALVNDHEATIREQRKEIAKLQHMLSAIVHDLGGEITFSLESVRTARPIYWHETKGDELTICVVYGDSEKAT